MCIRDRCQIVSLPRLKHKSFQVLEGAFTKKYYYPLASKTFKDELPDSEQCYSLDWKELIVPSSSRQIRSFYCERSARVDDMIRLKITHKLSIRFRLQTRSMKKQVWLSLEVPIVLADAEMISSLFLPPYQK